MDQQPAPATATVGDGDEWKACARWLSDCGIIAPNHPCLLETGNVIDFVQLLRSGVALCCLLSKLSSGQLDFRSSTGGDFSPAPGNSQFLCCQNLRLFAHLCQHEFGIVETDLIEPADIYQVKNIGKAIRLLSKLSLSPRAQSCGISGFDCESSKSVVVHDYYNNLEHEAPTLPLTYATTDAKYAQFDEESKEKIYDTLVVNRTAKTSQPESSGPSAGRLACIKEIVDTEKHFVELLGTLMEKYKSPLTGVLSQQEIDEILKYIGELHSIHRNLYAELCIATAPTTSSNSVGPTKPVRSLHEIFVNFRDRLLIYGEYCGHVEHAQSLIQDMLRSGSPKGKAIEKCQLDSGNYCKFQLDELLTVPAQRVLKYHVLLESLHKLTPADNPDKADIFTAFQSMRELALAINEFKRDSDAVGAINRVRSKITGMTLQQGWKLSDYGRLHFDGDVKQLNEANQRQKSRYLFLFDRIIVICKTKGDTFDFLSAHFIKKVEFGELSVGTKKGDKYTYGFTLPIAGDNEGTTYKFFAKSNELRKSWLDAANTALDNIHPAGYKDKGYRFEMYTFSQPTYCIVCKKLLTGCFFQGYRCRYKHIPAHKQCLTNNDLPPVQIGGRDSSSSRRRSTTTSPVAKALNGSSSCFASPSHQTQSSFSSLRQASPPAFDNTFQGGGGGSLPSTPTRQLRGSASALFAHPNRLPPIGQNDGFGDNQPCWLTRALVVGGWVAGELPLPPPGLIPLSLQAGDTVDVVNYSRDAVWLKGTRNNMEGWFPASIIDHSSVRSLTDTVASIRLASYPHSSVYDPSSSTTTARPPVLRRSAPLGDSTMRPNNHLVDAWFTFDQQQLNGPITSTLLSSLSAYDWYVGEMDRIEAVQLLADCDDGTFLVRVSTSAERRGELSISVVYLTARHIRINRFRTGHETGYAYGLCESTRFADIPSLIDYYSTHSLKHCFDGVDVTLAYPYSRCPANTICFVRVKYDFIDASNPRLLTLHQGDSIAVLKKDVNERGWWKGWLRGRIGFFPQMYVEEIFPSA